MSNVRSQKVPSRSLLSIYLSLAMGTNCNAGENSAIVVPPITIQPPSVGEWTITRRTDFGVVFSRIEPDNRGYSIAYANLFETRLGSDPNAFLAEAEMNVEAFLKAPNYRILSTTYRATAERGYPCVRVHVKMEVAVPETTISDSYILPKQLRMLLCRHAGSNPRGFLIGYSYTAPLPVEPYESQADAFISGVHLNAK